MSFITTIREDIRTVKENDPRRPERVCHLSLLPPGLHAKWMHAPEHWLWEHGLHGPARVLSQITRFFTGVEIHPAAQLGRRLFIDTRWAWSLARPPSWATTAYSTRALP